MIRIFYLLICLLLFVYPASSQDSAQVKPVDTTQPGLQVPMPVTIAVISREVSKRPAFDSAIRWQPSLQQSFVGQYAAHIYTSNPYFGFQSAPIRAYTIKKEWHGKEALFYIMLVLVIFFALFRQAFDKYLGDLTRLFFRTSLKQKQLREQLIQTPLASMLLNLFFIICTAFYINFLFQYYHVLPEWNFWLILAYAALGLVAVYAIKFIWLKLAGWIFNFSEATDNYIFIVFIINKVIGIFLLPFLILLAFSSGKVYDVSFILSVIGLVGIIGYRFILTYGAVRNHIKVNLFHFFLYLCAFEIMPLLLIYKVLLLIFERSS